MDDRQMASDQNSSSFGSGELKTRQEKHFKPLTISSLQTNTYTFVNSEDANEPACNQDLHSLPFSY